MTRGTSFLHKTGVMMMEEMTLLRYNGFYCLNRVSTTIDWIVRRYVSQVLTRNNQNAAGLYRFGYILTPTFP